MKEGKCWSSVDAVCSSLGMLFSSTLFLFRFLPLVLLLHLVLRGRLRNAVLLAASLFFYAWGETLLVSIMLLSIVSNYGFGLWVDRARSSGGRPRLAVGAAVVFNLGLLIVFKYANWIWENLQLWGGSTVVPLLAWPDPRDPVANALGTPAGDLRLPIGISFFTFQAMSYVIDVYRKDVEVQRRLGRFALYVSLFPQLIAGPIVRYRDIALQLADRTITRAGFASGIRRFTIGLGKKMLIANVVAVPADAIFALQEHQLPASLAWAGIVCYSLQIYFDFSGYSDMAIGLGRMLGFEFLENFKHPYVSRSVTEFWRRWHISLSTWFRDYLYIPLGGNRRGSMRTATNLLIVFLLCGLWHGASWTFVIWGVFHGSFLILERTLLRERLERVPALARHAYVVLVFMCGWVLFRAEDSSHALRYFGAMLGSNGLSLDARPLLSYLSTSVQLALVAGVVGSIPWFPALVSRIKRSEQDRGVLPWITLTKSAGFLALSAIFLLSVMRMAAGTYNPFIYFRF